MSEHVWYWVKVFHYTERDIAVKVFKTLKMKHSFIKSIVSDVRFSEQKGFVIARTLRNNDFLTKSITTGNFIMCSFYIPSTNLYKRTKNVSNWSKTCSNSQLFSLFAFFRNEQWKILNIAFSIMFNVNKSS